MADLKSEFKFYLENKAEFHRDYLNKFIVLKNHQLLGVFSDMLSAVTETTKTHELGTFLVQHVNGSDEQVRFHSRYSAIHGNQKST